MNTARRQAMLLSLTALALPSLVLAQKRHGPGTSDTEIKIGSTMPFSGPVSSLGILGKASQAYFAKLNATGGINGRKVTLIQYDDGYNPGKALELTRKLVEQDEVSFIFQTLGTPTNTAIHRYLNERRIPQLFIFSGASKWVNLAEAPFVMPGTASYAAEGRVYARWLLETKPAAKIAVLLQNDDFGKDYLDAIKAGLGAKAKSMIVAESTYETTDPSVDSQIVSLKSSGADVFFSLSNGKFAVQSLRKAHDIGWKPQIILPLGSSSLHAILRPAGTDKVVGAVTVAVAKSPSDPQWDRDPEIGKLRAFVKEQMPNTDPNDQLVAAGYAVSQILEQVLLRCGDDLTRENIMAQAQSLRGFRTGTLLPGVSLNASRSSHELYDKLWLQRFDGTSWVPFGNPIPIT